MSEKKQVLYDLRTVYSGPFAVEDFYSEVDKWIKAHNYEKEPKKKMEQITKEGKRIQYVIEAYNHLDELHHGIIVVKALFDNVKEITIKRDKKKMKINNGDALIQIDGFIDAHLHGSIYAAKPIWAFTREIIDKYIWNFKGKYDGVVNSDARDLFRTIQAFFNLQKMKCE